MLEELTSCFARISTLHKRKEEKILSQNVARTDQVNSLERGYQAIRNIFWADRTTIRTITDVFLFSSTMDMGPGRRLRRKCLAGVFWRGPADAAAAKEGRRL
jgi:hypothetical protein